HAGPKDRRRADKRKRRGKAGPRKRCAGKWGREDSNLRRLSRRFYRPLPLAARAHRREDGQCSLAIVKRPVAAVAFASTSLAVEGAGALPAARFDYWFGFRTRGDRVYCFGSTRNHVWTGFICFR